MVLVQKDKEAIDIALVEATLGSRVRSITVQFKQPARLHLATCSSAMIPEQFSSSFGEADIGPCR